MNKKVLITYDTHPELLQGLEKLGYSYLLVPEISQQEISEIIHEFEGIVVASHIHADKQLMDLAPQLKFIARAGSGMENIDAQYAASKNIACLNSPEGNANSVGEHAIGLLLSLFHNISRSFNEIKKGQWLTQQNRVHELEGRTIGIIGYGNTGKAFAEKLQGFRMNVLCYDKYLENYSDQFAHEASMKQIFDQAEIVSVHVPLTSETLHMVNQDFINRFQHSFCLINTSRGKIVKPSDLLFAIKSNKIVAAGLDVYENENPDEMNPKEKEIFSQLLQSNKVILTPHIAGKSEESKLKIARTLLKKIEAFVK